MSGVAYIDTSALMKRFVTEARTADMEAFVLAGEYRLSISSLTITEFRSVLKRLLRQGQVNMHFVTRATEQLFLEVSNDSIGFQAIEPATFNLAGELIERLESPLGTLDALHLAAAKAARSKLLVSADRQLLRAAAEAGLEILDLS